MRIAFLCGSLEKGFDGVADYALRLAGYLRFLGCECCCISIEDNYLDRENATLPLIEWHDSVECFRLASGRPWYQKKAQLRSLLHSWQPDWISLQYVPYAFDDRGMPFSLKGCLSDVMPQAMWHVMAHELWVDPGARIKNRFLAPVQQHLFKSLFRRLVPEVIHTSNSYYCNQIFASGLRAEILPLFSNVVPLPYLQKDKPDCRHWSFVFFGSIHPEWNPRDLLTSVESVARQQGITSIEFLSIGLAGEHGHDLWNQLASESPSSIVFRQLGSLSALEISRHLSQADFGITTTPSYLIGKSGSVAAMLAHGLPVIVPRLEKTHGPWHSTLKADPCFILLDCDFSASLPRGRRFPAHDQLPDTANQFLQSLQRVV